jgi:hypothetical protein
MRLVRTALVIAAAASASAPATVMAQAVERSPFHPRQWGADFVIASGFAGVGVIHFRSADRAVVADLSGDILTSSSNGGGPRGNSNSATLSLGMRRYRGLAPSVELFHTLGIDVDYSHNYQPAGPTTTNGWGAGLFGELGAGWMVAPHLLLGVSWRVDATYSHTSTKTLGGSTSGHQLELSLGGVRLLGQLFF